MPHKPLSKKRAQQGFHAAAAQYDQHAQLQREIADRLIERLDFIKLDPQRILDLGTGTGYLINALKQRFPKAQIVGADLAHGMLAYAKQQHQSWKPWQKTPAWVCADAERLPFQDHSFDLVISSLMLQWCHPLDTVFRGIHRVIKPGGLVLFTTFGPDTLKELRWSWAQVDRYQRVHEFADMHDVGDAMVHARFADPVMDMEMITMTYTDLKLLVKDLRGIGARNASEQGEKSLTGKGKWRAMQTAYETLKQDGQYPASYEVVYGHAWAVENKAFTEEDGSVVVPISSIRRK